MTDLQVDKIFVEVLRTDTSQLRTSAVIVEVLRSNIPAIVPPPSGSLKYKTIRIR